MSHVAVFDFHCDWYGSSKKECDQNWQTYKFIMTLVKLFVCGHNRLFICQTFYLKQSLYHILYSLMVSYFLLIIFSFCVLF